MTTSWTPVCLVLTQGSRTTHGGWSWQQEEEKKLVIAGDLKQYHEINLPIFNMRMMENGYINLQPD